MLRTALALLSTLQIGARIKESLERSLRQAAIVAVAAVFLVAASIFGLIAAYQALDPAVVSDVPDAGERLALTDLHAIVDAAFAA